MEDIGGTAVGGALDTLFVRYYDELVRVATLLLGDPASGEDIVQEAYIRVESVVRRRGTEVGVGYLHRTVVNLSRSALRRRMVALRHAPKPMPDFAGADHDALILLEGEEVLAGLRTLPRRQREAVVLRVCADYSEADTAQLMGVSTGAVKAYASRGLAALRVLLEDQS